jgi:DNA-binding NarL/FixJ family response regulator
MSIEDNMKIASGLRRMGIMSHEVPQVEAMLAEGKSVKEIADALACDESVIEGFRPAAYDTPAEEEEEKPRARRK